MSKEKLFKIPIPLLHIGFWTAYLLLNGIAWTAFDVSYMQSSLLGLLFLPVKMIVVYLNFYLLMPAYLFKRKYILYALLIVSLMILGGIVQHLLVSYYSFTSKHGNAESGFLYVVLQYVIPINSIVFFTAMIKLLQEWYLQQTHTETLAKEKLGAELSFLKGQVHPHFLFNTLNNLYSLTLKQSELAPKIVLKLSELLSYMLYDASEKEVLLSKEITHFTNYIDIEKIRYGSRLDISLNISGDLADKTIEPMILLPFIENSFKHGIRNELDKAWITIDLKVKNHLLVFKVENSKGLTLAEHEGNHPNGIGLKNVKRRLDLVYPEKYHLNLQDQPEYFAVDLRLELTKSSLYA